VSEPRATSLGTQSSRLLVRAPVLRLGSRDDCVPKTKAPPLVKSDGAPVERVTLLMLGKNLTFSDGLVLPIQGGQVAH